MFQRLQKGLNLDFLDSKIAEEQEKQKQQQQSKSASPAKRSPSARRGSARTDSPSTRPRAGSRLRVADARTGEGGPATKGPDPDDFVIGDDASDVGSSRAATPLPVKEGDGEGAGKSEKKEESGASVSGSEKVKGRADEDALPLEVRQRLAKLDTLTTRYQDLLRNYRTAHAHVASIEPFEATLREHTPLTSISDPAALVEFLNQRSLQSTMVLEELRKITEQWQDLTKERDELKGKVDESEKTAKNALEKVARLEKELDEAKSSSKEKDGFSEQTGANGTKENADQSKAAKSDEDTSFFSYEDEVSRDEEQQAKIRNLEEQAKEQTNYINEISGELAGIKQEFEVKSLDLDAMHNKVRYKDDVIDDLQKKLQVSESLQRVTSQAQDAAVAAHSEIKEKADVFQSQVDSTTERLKNHQDKQAEINETEKRAMQDAIEKLQRELEDTQARLKDVESAKEAAITARTEVEAKRSEIEADRAELQRRAGAAEENLKKYQDEQAQNVNNATTSEREAKRMKTLENLVTSLRGQVKALEEGKSMKDQELANWQFECKKLEAEVSGSSNTISHLRQLEASYRDVEKKLLEAEHRRDEAQRVLAIKKGHEKAAADLRVQVKNMEKQRDHAYDLVIKCGRCIPPGEQLPGLSVDNGGGSNGSGSNGGGSNDSPGTGGSSNNDSTNGGTQTPNSASTPEPRSRGGSEATETSTLPTEAGSEVQTPAAQSGDGNELALPGEPKKKNKKKKSKAKKKTAAEADVTSPAPAATKQDLTLEDLLRDPELAPDVLLKSRFGDNPMVPLLARITSALKEKGEAGDEGEQTRQYLENLNEQLTQNVTDKDVVIRAKVEEIHSLQARLTQNSEVSAGSAEQDKQKLDALETAIAEKDSQIEKLQERLKGEAILNETIEELRDENSTLQESVLENGTAATDAKHELKEVKERRDKLQEEFNELQREADDHRKRMTDAEAQKEYLSTRCADLESEVSTLKSKSVSSDELEGVKEQLANTIKEKDSLQLVKETCERELEELKSAQGAELDAKNNSLLSDLEALRTRTSSLEKELADANQLSQTRYKDLSEVQEHYNQAQLELKRLRNEAAELKDVKAEFEKSQSTVKRLEARQRDLTSEITEYKSQASEKDSEIVSLKENVQKGEERSKALEDSYETARKDLEKSESVRNEAQDTRDKLRTELKRVQDELKKSKPRLEELEQQVKKLTDESSSLRDEVQLKTAQQASAQSLMDSMREERNELATQMKELKDRNESLEEEIADAHRLLSERGREGETMRRLLVDVETRADAKVREMKEKMDLATADRDRAEDELSSIGRRKAREIEDLKNKVRDAEREASRAKEAREEAERKEAVFKKRQTELEEAATRAQESSNETRKAMAQLQETFDETEQLSRELEKQKLQLRKELQERDARIEKIQVSSKSMAEELKLLRAKRPGSVTPSRSSLDSSRVTSPVPRGNNTAANQTSSHHGSGPNLPYLRTVLLQFLDQKEKKYQTQLVPVIGQLLEFGTEEQNKLMTIVNNR